MPSGAGSTDSAPITPSGDTAPGTPNAPVISLPKGGGAIRGIGEKFTANLVTGTGGLSVPLAISPGRSGFGPSLALGYDSAAGNGPFGIGWGIGLPAITRKTDKGIPGYADEGEDFEDTFILSGTEDLVPVLVERGGEWIRNHRSCRVDGSDYAVCRYRPRVEGLYARIERWTDVRSGDVHWRSISRDNVTTVYGRDAASRIADPNDARRVFSWLICESHDDAGNAVRYEYKTEDGSGVDLAAGCERNRTAAGRAANRYLKRIRYGNTVSRLVSDDSDHMFEIVFDYGEHDESTAEVRPWACRLDPFSSYRAGFEIRGYRLCRRVLMFHHFPDEPDVGRDCLVRSTELVYRGDAERGGVTGAFLESVSHSGWRRASGGYLTRSMPPLEFSYSQAEIDTEVRTLDAADLENAPIGVDGSAYRWTDLEGDGLAGLLTEQAGTWFYKPNLGGGHLGPMRVVRSRPTGGRTELLDLDGDGRPAVVDFGGTTPGFTERSDQDWEVFRPFRSRPNLAWDDPNLRFVDLSGDGRADVLVTGEPGWTWYRSLGEEGFDSGRRTWPSRDEESGPQLVFADRTSSIHLADLSGDGLADLVRIRNGEICYWPNLGHGRFGAKVGMDGAPRLDSPDQFDPARIRLADVDGSGPADLIYLHRDGVRLYLNRSGNAWSSPHALPVAFPRIENVSKVAAIDLLGSGTGCLVWSSPLPAESGRQLRYLDLMRGGKPHLLTRVRNNLGAETHIRYAPSTRFYAEDAAAGRPWLTRLPFVVHLVERVETVDAIGRHRFVSRYAYHHGHFDGPEREFRGFGMVEQTDTEALEALAEAGNVDEATYRPPTLTRTWFHTGAFLPGQRISRQFEREYHSDDLLLPDTVLPDGLTADEARQACRSLKGSVLRTEVYALDDSDAVSRPYRVTEHNHLIRMLQPAVGHADSTGAPHAVFDVHPRETLTGHYERTVDPRVGHELTLAVDAYGNVLRSVTVGYGRTRPSPDLDEREAGPQRRTHIVLTDHDYTNAVEEPDSHRVPLPCRTRAFEVLALRPAGDRFTHAELTRALTGIDQTIPYQDWDALPAKPALRLTEHVRTLYRSDDLSEPLPLGTLQSRALPYQEYRLAFPDGLVTALYGDRVDEPMLRSAGYLRHEGGWWIPSARTAYAPPDTSELDYAERHFFLPCRFTDPLGDTSTVSYDDYDLLLVDSTDQLGNRYTVGERDADGRTLSQGNDYRVLRPALVTDPNRNRVQMAYDVHARVTGTATMGKREESLGDSLDGFDPDPSPALVARYLADPLAAGPALLKSAGSRFCYDESAFWLRGEPAMVATLVRHTHQSDLAPGEQSRITHTIAYSDGFGREVQSKVQAEPGPLSEGGPVVEPRWAGTGWTIFNNKGNPVRTFEPFFTETHAFEFAVIAGVSTVLLYDPLERVVGSLHPDHTYAKTVFDPWRQRVWDGNDTVLTDPRQDPDIGGQVRQLLATEPGWTTWHAARADGALGPEQRRAAEKAALHAHTPTDTHLDSLARPFRTVAHNRHAKDGTLVEERLVTRTSTDVEGNVREVRDPLGRAAIRHAYSMVGMQVSRAGIDYGAGALLPDVLGNPRCTWNSRGFRFRTEYDAGHRPVRAYVSGPGLAGEVLHQKTEYGEDPDRNLRTRVFRRHDGSGVSTHEAYDFRGNLLEATRRFPVDYRRAPDWREEVALEEEVYTGRTRFDALDRPISITSPDGTMVRPYYNEANLLERLVATSDGRDTVLIAGVEYNARGQRTRIDYGNGARTRYTYDPLTFRLTALRTRRERPRSRRERRTVQHLAHCHDPVGNIVSIRDTAQQRTFFRNRVVEPGADYTYDAVYRLIEATGREHLGQTDSGDTGAAPRVGLAHPGDGAAMGRYLQRYVYDSVGNMLSLEHRASTAPGWTRRFRYAEPSALEPEVTGNRLSGVGDGEFAYDARGNTTAMPGLPVLRWDPEDQLETTARQVRGAGAPQTTYYSYDATGQRVRKVTDSSCGEGGTARRSSERRYIGPFEVYREYGADGAVTLERQTVHAMDDTRRVALLERRTRGADSGPEHQVRYQLADHLGSATLELDERARILTYEEYYPYGGTAYQAVRAKTETPKRYRFTGRERDTETGLYFHGARYYAPWLCRWTSCDPIDTPQASSYEYAHGNPVALVDLDGRNPTPPTHTIDDILEFVRNQAGFEAGASTSPGAINRTPLNFSSKAASPFGTAAHGRVGGVLRELQQLGVQGAERIYADVRVIGGTITDIGVPPGGPKGAHNLDVVVAKVGQTLAKGQSLLGGVAEAIGDFKYGGGRISQKYAVYLSKLLTLNARPLAAADFIEDAASTAANVEQAAASTQQAVTSTVSAAATETASVAKTVSTTAQVASETGVAAKAVGTGARALQAAAPVLKVVGKVAAPLAVAATALQVATAKTTAEKVDAGIGVVSTAVGFAGPPGAVAAVGIQGTAYVSGKVGEIVTEKTGSETAGVAAATLTGAAAGAGVGAVVGSIVPGVGTAVGAGVGAVVGAGIGFVKSYWK
ncbi:SpvB/TcaC N-terminal domain-containing protein [Streptomyces sioyaensis]|uniref:SpvB/TcaC N-terminal domain-containing protein n=1 Tax=Streptomyces sioyaensis TaxID=67364 RepID=UPI0033C2CE6B